MRAVGGALLPALLLVSVLSGCVGGDDPLGADASAPETPATHHVLNGLTEPVTDALPSFRLMSLARTGPVYGGGEPSIWAHMDGSIWITFPGCDTGLYLVAIPGQPTCGHGVVFSSRDDGDTWTRHNDAQSGRLTDEGPGANGDADIAIDAGGTIYASDLGAGIQVLRSGDGGASWEHIANVVEVDEDHWADRQWMAAGVPGHLIMTWMGGAPAADEQACERCVAINVTFDDGENWTGVQYVGEDIGWLGTVQIDPTDAWRAYIPFTENRGEDFALLVAKTVDGGRTWEVLDTEARSRSHGLTGRQWSGVLMAPALDVTGDGTVAFVWSEERPLEPFTPAGALMADGAVVKMVASTDHGANWTSPFVLSERNAIMPWVTGGAGDRIAVTWYASDLPLDTDYVGRWDVEVAYVDDVAASPQVQRSVVDTDVHLGGLCARGGGCLISGSDRALLDFFESDLLPDGRLVLTYAADPLERGKYIEIRVAVEEGPQVLAVRG